MYAIRSYYGCNPGDLLLFPPEARHFYGRAPDSPDWYHRWVYFRPRGFWAPWLQWRDQVNKVGRMTLPNETLVAEFDMLFQQIEETYKAGRRSSEELALNLLERLLIRCFEETPENSNDPVDPRIEEACQYISRNLASDLTLEDVRITSYNVCYTKLLRVPEQVGGGVGEAPFAPARVVGHRSG